MNRRVFLGSLVAGAATLGRRPAVAQAQPTVKLGLIGCGWYGGVVLDAAYKAGGVELLAACDVDSERVAAAAKKYGAQQAAPPRTFKHWKDLLDVPGLQAVVIATPPHWHALPFIEACRRGLDIYCEKPLAYDVREGRAMVDAAKASGRVVQVGFQRRQSEAVKQAARYLAEGHAGRVLAVDAQIHYAPKLADPAPKTPPASLDWEQWCGPAPLLPYSEQVGHFNWRLEKAYGNGHLVDWGIHWIDAIRTVLKLGAPTGIQAAGGLYQLKGRITTPDVLNATFEFGDLPVTWRHRLVGAPEYAPETNIGMFFYGERETVFLTDSKYVVIPAGKDVPRRTVDAGNDQQLAHVSEFLHAVRTRGPVSCTPEDAHRSTASVQLAMVALETGSRLAWDGGTEQVRDNPRAASLLKRDYRGPWVHPYSGRS
ncbi:MAG TPA: Gfo/Idh/MocA family oxidoreductase [Gemmatimonadales bacterium]|nr:Gfo/Idh/MocA family oxidoreductase [Gemmatimonadales bacterium]